MLLTEFLKTKLSEGFTFLLLEDRINFIYDKNKEQLQDRFSKDNNVPARYKKIGDGDIAKNLITHFSSIDPSKKKIYIQWMTKLYLTGLKLEDFDKLKAGLGLFDKPAIKNKLKVKDINQYKTINDLLIAVQPFKDEEVISNKEAKARTKAGEVEWIINDSNFKVLIPKTHKASCMYGANTEWCTTSKDNSSEFDSHSKQGPLYIIISGSGDNVKKFQLHYESDQFLDANDNELSKSQIDYLSGFPQYKDFLNMLIKKHYSKYFDK